MNRKLSLVISCILLVVMVGVVGAAPQQSPHNTTGTSILAAPDVPTGTAFTYQGRLTSGGNPANGNYDFQFKLFDAAAGGTQIGTTQTSASLGVANGLFTTALDFGAVFSGRATWLELAVRPANTGNYNTLSPRQSLTAAPYAMGLRPGTIVSEVSSSPLLNIVNSGSGSALYSNSASGPGVEGVSTSDYGVYGTSSTSDAIHGESVDGDGVYGESVNGNGVSGRSDGAGHGVWGLGEDGAGVYGISDSGDGVVGDASDVNRSGVYGTNSAPGPGVAGYSAGGVGVHGRSTNNYGVYGASTSNDGIHGRAVGIKSGVWGHNEANGYGVSGSSPNGTGVLGVHEASTGTAPGVEGRTNSNDTNGAGVVGRSQGLGSGVYGESVAGYGVYGKATDGSASNFGIYGTTNSTTNGYAGFFSGRVHVAGTLSKSAGSFKIDHPVDPANKYLSHSFVESPDMMNVYNGNVTTDAKGDAVVVLPDYFEALNKDFRYQLTVMGQFAQAIVARKVEKNSFTIKTDKPNVEVSWQVTGIRHDPYAEQHRIPVEEDKTANEQGKYLQPELYGKPDDLRLNRVEQK